MKESQKCNQCYRPFTVDHLPRQLPCGHNICQECLEEIFKSDFNVIFCQYCQKTIPRKGEQLPFSENTPLQIEQNKGQSLSPPKLNRQQTETLLDDKPFHLTASSLNEICPMHQVMMDIICTTDRKKICPHCALFGDHKKHNFKRIDDFQQQMTDKCQLFIEIQAEKENSKVNEQQQEIMKQIQNAIEGNKIRLIKQVNETVQNTFEVVISLQNKVLQQIETYFSQLNHSLRNNKALEQLTESKNKFQNWQKKCQTNINKLQQTEAIEQKIDLYFNEPLQIVSEGYMYLQTLNQNHQSIEKYIQNINKVRLNTTDLNASIEKAFKLVAPGNYVKQQYNNVAQQQSEQNPFMDCTSSEIGIDGPSLIDNNVSIQDQICSLTNSVKVIHDDPPSRIVSSKLMSSQRSPQNSTCNQFRRATICSPKPSTLKDTRTSDMAAVRSAKKLTKTVLIKPAIQPQLKDCDLKQPDRRLADFMKSTLTDFLDLSDCHLPSDKVVEYVSKARKHHRIKGLKLCDNYLDCRGFERMIDNLKGVTNINLASNQLTQSIFQIIMKNKERLDLLRVLNLTHNPICLEKKSRTRLEQLKKTGMIINV